MNPSGLRRRAEQKARINGCAGHNSHVSPTAGAERRPWFRLFRPTLMLFSPCSKHVRHRLRSICFWPVWCRVSGAFARTDSYQVLLMGITDNSVTPLRLYLLTDTHIDLKQIKRTYAIIISVSLARDRNDRGIDVDQGCI